MSAAPPGGGGHAVGSRPAWLNELSRGLADPAALRATVGERPGVGARAAAVLILIGALPGRERPAPRILFVERAVTLRTHAGQIAFPGGSADPDDQDLAATALREAVEETGVDATGIEVLGSLPRVHVAVSGFDVTAVIGWWHTPSPVRAADPSEVASVQLIPVAELTRDSNRAMVQHPSGYTGPAFSAGGWLIWGLTAHFVDAVLGLAGWQLPWDQTRQMPIPSRYLTGRIDHGGPDAH